MIVPELFSAQVGSQYKFYVQLEYVELFWRVE
jgi:hypothetical protein